MAKTDVVLDHLKSAYVSYIRSFLPFEYEKRLYNFTEYYISIPWTRCDVCNSYPIQDVFVVRSDDGKELHLGKECIDSITNRKVSEWFKEYETKRNNVIINSRYIDGLDSILSSHDKNQLLTKISESEINRLKNTSERMCNGFNTIKQEEQTVEYYLSLSSVANCMYDRKLLEKIEIMRYIAYCLPASLPDLCAKVKNRYNVMSHTAISEGLHYLKELEIIHEGNCSCCGHKVWTINPFQKIYHHLQNGSLFEDTVFIFKEKKIDPFVFGAVLISKIENIKSPLKKAQRLIND